MKKISVLLFLLFLSEISIGQNTDKHIDSLVQNIQRATNDTSRVNGLNVLCTSLWLKGDLGRAMTKGNEALELATKIGYKKGIINAYNEIGFINAEKGNYPEALKNSLASMSIEEKINDKRGMVNTFINIGNIYFDQKNYEEALNKYISSLKMAEEIDDKKAMARSYNNIGNVYFKQLNYTEALKNNSLALKIAGAINDKNTLAHSYLNIGNVYEVQGNRKEAMKNYLASLKIEEEIDDKKGMAASYINLGDLNLILKPLDAWDYYNKGLALSKMIGNKGEIAYCYDGLAQVDSITGKLAEAYHYSRLYYQIKDSMLNEKSDKQISQLKIQYETDEKDQRIKTQELRNGILQTQIYYGVAISLMVIGIILLLFYLFFLRNKRKKKEYEHTLTELELSVLKAQLNPHFISNSLTNIKTFIDQQPERASQFLTKFARLMRRVLEQNEKSLISLKEEMETAELYMQIEAIKTRYGFDYLFSCDPSIDIELFKVPPLILQPVIENAIWHGLAYKDEKGYINIGIKLENDILKFTIEDNGVGQSIKLETDNIKPANTKSFGLSITRKRIDVLSKEFGINGYFNLIFLDGHTVAEIGLPAIQL